MDEFVIFCDNLDGQTCDAFRDNLGVTFAMGHLGKPVDGGFGRLLKVLIKAEQQEWLECDENIEKWIGNDQEKFSAKDRRILMTHWIGEAFEKLQGSKYDYSRWQCFERTGCLITADGSDNDKIKPDGMPDYLIPHQMPTVSADDPFESVAPAAEPIPDDSVELEDDYNILMNAPQVPEEREIDLWMIVITRII